MPSLNCSRPNRRVDAILLKENEERAAQCDRYFTWEGIARSLG